MTLSGLVKGIIMIRNRPIFHCQNCGAVVRQEASRMPPFCCGQIMFKAGEETLSDAAIRELDGEWLGFNESQTLSHGSAHEAEPTAA